MARPRSAVRTPSGPPRLTSRAAILVLILAVLAVSYASSLRAYLDQRAEIQEKQADIAAAREQIAAQEDEIERWSDDAYVQQRAREQLGMVRPGEKPFVIVRDGEPLEPEAELADLPEPEPTPWWEDAWETVEIAGDPPTRVDPPPARRIDDAEGAPEEE